MTNTTEDILEKERGERIIQMIQILKELFPTVGMALSYSNHWELLVAVMLSAQCTDIRVNIVTEKLFKKYKTLDEYAHASLSEFENDIRQTGFFRNKAKNIIATANILKNEYGGVLPRTMEEMVALPGVARKTSNVVLGNAYGIVEGIAVDTHVRRFCIRFNLTDSKNPQRIERDLMKLVPREDWFMITYWLIEYGREYCPARKHSCEDHPLTVLYPEAATIWPLSK